MATTKGKAGIKSKAKAEPKGSSSRERVRNHRAKMRAQGLRLLQIWVPDTRTPEFAAQAHRDSLAIARSKHDADEQAFIDAISIPVDD